MTMDGEHRLCERMAGWQEGGNNVQEITPSDVDQLLMTDELKVGELAFMSKLEAFRSGWQLAKTAQHERPTGWYAMLVDEDGDELRLPVVAWDTSAIARPLPPRPGPPTAADQQVWNDEIEQWCEDMALPLTAVVVYIGRICLAWDLMEEGHTIGGVFHNEHRPEPACAVRRR